MAMSPLPSTYNAHSSVHRHVIFSALQAKQPCKFEQGSKRINLIPLYKKIFSDQLTPVLAYRALVKENDQHVPSFLMEDMHPGLCTHTLGRYSVIGAYPAMEIVVKENFVTMLDHLNGQRSEEFVADPTLVPQRIIEKWMPKLDDHLPQVFSGGWIGYFSYDTMRYMEPMFPFSAAPMDNRNLPDIHLGLYDEVILFDHVKKKAYAIHWVQLDRFSTEEEALKDGRDRLDTLLARIHDTKITLIGSSVEENSHFISPKLEITNRVTSEAYKKVVLESKQQIKASNISQIALSQRFETRTFANPFEVYRAFRTVNPIGHFTTYLQARGCVLVASGANQKLTPFDKVVTWDALRAELPSRTFTGAPKVKAMELIDKLETTRRGPYGGGFCSISFSGDVDFTMLGSQSILFPGNAIYDTIYSYDYENYSRRREWVAHLQAGSMVLLDSQPEDMDKECKKKIVSLARVISVAESCFV